MHDEAELDAALAAGAELIGINNRDLRSFETDLAVTERLAPRVPRGVVVVAESGIFTRADVARLARAGAHALLVGESLMRAADLAARAAHACGEDREHPHQDLRHHPPGRRRAARSTPGADLIGLNFVPGSPR